MRYRAIVLSLGVCLAAIAAPLRAQEKAGPGMINFYLGAMNVDDQSFNIDGDGASGDFDIDFSTLPGGGIVVEMPFRAGGLEAGVEVGAGVAWKNQDTSFAGRSIDGDTTIVVDIDNAFLLADLQVGLFARAKLGSRASIYLGGGPTFVYGRHEVEDEDVEPEPLDGTTIILQKDDASDFNLGYYARAGIDFRVAERLNIGFGARLLGVELDFDDTVGKTDIDGVFYFVNISQPLD